MEVLDPVLPKALPRVWPREPSFQLELEVMTGQAEHPLGQCMRQGHVVGETQVREARGGEGRGQGGAAGAGHRQCHWEEVPSSWAAPAARPLCQAPGSRRGPGPLALPTVGRRKPRCLR